LGIDVKMKNEKLETLQKTLQREGYQSNAQNMMQSTTQRD